MKTIYSFILLMVCSPIFAATYTVTNTNDAGVGSFRQAVEDANNSNGSDIIVFNPSTNGIPIVLTTGQVYVKDNLTITGNGNDSTILSGNNASTIIDMQSKDVSLTVEDIRLIDSQGSALISAGNSTTVVTGCYFKNNTVTGNGGAINFDNSVFGLVVDDCTFEGNSATTNGGAIQINTIGCDITNSTFTNNSSTAGGGALMINDGVNSFTNCTFWENSSNVGGAIRAYVSPGSEIINCTFAENNANSIGGAIAQTEADQLYFSMINTIIANNTAGGNGKDIYLELGMSGTISNNIVEDCFSGNSTCPTWFSTADPSLDTLADNGGTTQTVALLCGSIAINAGTSVNAPNMDQRGISRIDSTDIGAYEFDNFITTTNNDTICQGGSITVGTSTYSDAGTYVDSLTTTNNCDSVVTTNLTVTTIDKTVTVTGGVLMANQTGATYQWIECDSLTPISGATNQTYSPVASGSYAVIVTVDECSDTSACNQVVSIGELGTTQQVKMFPNPANGFVNIQLSKASTVSVYNAIGRLVMATTELTTTHNMNITQLPAGMYLVKVGEKTHKLIVQ